MLNQVVKETLNTCKPYFEKYDETALVNQEKVIKAFQDNEVALRHFAGTNGYGNDDAGRDTLCKVLAQIFVTEAAVVSPLITSGTHAITLALFGILRPGDVVLSVTGKPYDTLHDVIFKKGIGSLNDFGVKFEYIDLVNGQFNFDEIENYLKSNKVKMVYVQRSRGYDNRLALSIEQIEKIAAFSKSVSPSSLVFCDNCYGEFVETREPTEVGVDACAGSFIKNIGGGIAPTGGYIVGKESLIEGVAGRLTAPSIGMDVGSYTPGYRLFYQGIFLAPHVVCQALKTATLFSCALQSLGYDVLPKLGDHFGDIVCTISLGNEQKIVNFCKAVQASSPIDGFVSPEPWQMPGYNDKVIMAAGCFVQGASIELSCDAPIRPPYVVYLQGGLTLEHGILALNNVINSLTK